MASLGIHILHDYNSIWLIEWDDEWVVTVLRLQTRLTMASPHRFFLCIAVFKIMWHSLFGMLFDLSLWFFIIWFLLIYLDHYIILYFMFYIIFSLPVSFFLYFFLYFYLFAYPIYIECDRVKCENVNFSIASHSHWMKNCEWKIVLLECHHSAPTRPVQSAQPFLSMQLLSFHQSFNFLFVATFTQLNCIEKWNTLKQNLCSALIFGGMRVMCEILHHGRKWMEWNGMIASNELNESLTRDSIRAKTYITWMNEWFWTIECTERIRTTTSTTTTSTSTTTTPTTTAPQQQQPAVSRNENPLLINSFAGNNINEGGSAPSTSTQSSSSTDRPPHLSNSVVEVTKAPSVFFVGNNGLQNGGQPIPNLPPPPPPPNNGGPPPFNGNNGIYIPPPQSTPRPPTPIIPASTYRPYETRHSNYQRPSGSSSSGSSQGTSPAHEHHSSTRRPHTTFKSNSNLSGSGSDSSSTASTKAASARLNMGGIIALGVFGGFVFLAAMVTIVVIIVRRWVPSAVLYSSLVFASANAICKVISYTNRTLLRLNTVLNSLQPLLSLLTFPSPLYLTKSFLFSFNEILLSWTVLCSILKYSSERKIRRRFTTCFHSLCVMMALFGRSESFALYCVQLACLLRTGPDQCGPKVPLSRVRTQCQSRAEQSCLSS